MRMRKFNSIHALFWDVQLTLCRSLNWVWTSATASDLSIGLLDGIIPTPPLETTHFLDATVSTNTYRLLSSLKLATCLRTHEVVEKYVVPNWKSLETTSCSYSCKEQLARLVLSQYSSLSPACRISLRKLPLVPVARLDGGMTSRFSLADHLINPSISGMKALFFGDEEVVPERSFFDQFTSSLNDIGLRNIVDEDLVYSRAQKFANSNYPLPEIEQRVYALLKSSCWSYSTKVSPDKLELRRQKWLPVISKGSLQLQVCVPGDFLISCQLFRFLRYL